MEVEEVDISHSSEFQTQEQGWADRDLPVDPGLDVWEISNAHCSGDEGSPQCLEIAGFDMAFQLCPNTFLNPPVRIQAAAC